VGGLWVLPKSLVELLHLRHLVGSNLGKSRHNRFSVPVGKGLQGQILLSPKVFNAFPDHLADLVGLIVVSDEFYLAPNIDLDSIFDSY